MRQRYSAEQWLAWIEQQAASGVTIADFCDSIGVAENTFYVWRRKLRSETVASAISEAGLSCSFVEIAVADADARSAGLIEIELPCGALVRVPAADSLIRQVLGVLLESGAAYAGGSSC